MKAWLSRNAGGPETLELSELPVPEPAPGQVQIRVAAVSLNFPDVLMIEDKYQVRPPRPFAPGGDVAGVVSKLGEGVTAFKVGDRVCALAGYNGLAEYVVCELWKVTRIPDGMSFDAASTLKTAYGTSIHALMDRGDLKAGQSLLVLGAAGGVGLSAVEIGKALGARVVGAVSTPEKAEAVRAAGAEEVIIYPRGTLDRDASKALADTFKAACPGGYDVIYDAIGGDYAEPALRAIGWEGRYLVIGFTAGIPKIPLNLPLLKACSIVGVFWGIWAQRNPGLCAAQMEILFRFQAEGKIGPQISERFPFDKAPEALTRLRDRAAVGKLVVLAP